MSKTLTISPTDRIATFKTVYSSIPANHKRSNNAVFEHFSGFFYSYHSFIKAEDESTKATFGRKCNYHMEKLWTQILHEFMSPMWCYGDSGYDESLWEKMKGPLDIYKVRIVLREADLAGEFINFFKAYPYVRDLLFIDEFFSSKTKSKAAILKFSNIMSNYLIALDKYDALLPILVLKEHINLMLGREEFDQEFYSKHMKGAERCLKGGTAEQLQFLSMFVSNDTIPYSVRSSDVGFKKFNWNALDGLYKAVFSGAFSKFVSNTDLIIILKSIENYLEKLILFEVGAIEVDEVPDVDLGVLSRINTEANLEPAFKIIEHYLNIAETINDNSHISRLAILRVITAVGEAIFVIKSLIPSEKIGLLEKLNELRDHILHSSTNESFRYLSDLIYNGDNDTLDNILAQLLELKEFFCELKEWFASDRKLDKFPAIPDLDDVAMFEAEYAANRSKDDRDVKLSLADHQTLEGSIPVEDEMDNELFDIVSDFVNCKEWINRNKFAESCIGSKDPATGEYRTTSQLKKLHDKFCELNKIKQIRAKMTESDFDFNSIKLNLKKPARAELERIKQEKDLAGLEELLSQHETAKFVDIGEFLDSVRRLDLTGYKETLRKFAEEESVSQDDFSEAVQVVFRGNSLAQMNWRDAYAKYHGNMESFKRDQAVQVEFAIQSIEVLKDVANTVHTGTRINIQNNPVAALACEMQFGLCTNNIKSVMKFIDRMFDYTDQSLYFICLPHPISETKDMLDFMVTTRNDLFHFERTFNGPFTIEGHRIVWFSILENLTHGIFFPEAIIISPSGVSKEPRTSDSNLLKLKKYFELVKQSLQADSSDTINVYELTMSGSPSDLDSGDSLSEGIELSTQDDTLDQEVTLAGFVA